MILLALGTNLGDRLQNLQTALRMLEEAGISVRAVSSVYETAALLPEGAPPEWDIPYYNLVLSATAPFSPPDLLAATQQIQNRMGREDKGRWGPRIIDIDILAFNDEVVNMPDLEIPHPRMLERDFVMVPLAEIMPQWSHPTSSTNVQAHVKEHGFADHEGLRRVDVEIE